MEIMTRWGVIAINFPETLHWIRRISDRASAHIRKYGVDFSFLYSKIGTCSFWLKETFVYRLTRGQPCIL